MYPSIIQYIAYTKDTCTPYEKQRYMIMCNFLLVAHEVSIQIYRSGEKKPLQAAPRWCSGLKLMPRMRKVRCSNSGCDRQVVTDPVLNSLATDLINRVGNGSPIMITRNKFSNQ